MIGRRIFNLYLLKVFSVICHPIPASLLPMKAMVLYMSRTHNCEEKDAAYTQVFMVFDSNWWAPENLVSSLGILLYR